MATPAACGQRVVQLSARPDQLTSAGKPISGVTATVARNSGRTVNAQTIFLAVAGPRQVGLVRLGIGLHGGVA